MGRPALPSTGFVPDGWKDTDATSVVAAVPPPGSAERLAESLFVSRLTRKYAGWPCLIAK
jgi:hypothetical protein